MLLSISFIFQRSFSIGLMKGLFEALVRPTFRTFGWKSADVLCMGKDISQVEPDGPLWFQRPDIQKIKKKPVAN